MNLHAQWNSVARVLRNSLGENVWRSWFKQLVPYRSYENELSLNAPDSFTAEWINSNYAYSLRDVNGIRVRVDGNAVKHNSNTADTPKHNLPHTQQQQQNTHGTTDTSSRMFNAEMRLENFVVGAPNQIAFEVHKRLIDACPAQLPYNPLYLHGTAGVGKTHLMNAACHALTEKNMRVQYITAHGFLEGFINALRTRSTSRFTEELIENDALFFDDFQFLIGKSSTQQEFFRIMNMLVERKKIIVISADKLPTEWNSAQNFKNAKQDLDPRMRSRLAASMIVTIHEPDYELRLGLIKSWHPLLSSDAASALASIQTSVRELKGALTRVLVQASCLNTPVTPEFVTQTLHDLISSPGLIPSLESIMSHVLGYAKNQAMKVSKDQIVNGGRLAPIVQMRQIFMYLAHELGSTSPSNIGKYLGNRDRTTVQYGLKRIKNKLNTDQSIASAVSAIKYSLGC